MQATRRIPRISTKLYVPASPPDIIPRESLSRRLGDLVRHRLLLVSAPAGSGKTTLLSQWAQDSAWPVAWVSLDSADNDPVRFWSYLAAALDGLEPNIGRHLLPALHRPRPESGDFVVAMLVDLAALIPDPFVLILDDYHCIESEAIHAALTSLLDYLPPTMHLVLASRTDPALPLARWRAQGHMAELRAPELRFSPGEAESLLNQAMRLGLSEQELAALHEWTEGWPAGLRLAGLTVAEQRARQEPSTLPGLRDDGRYFTEYLTSEVLQRQQEPLRRFLLQTAILETLSAPVCEAVTEQPNSQAMLDELYRRNLFVTALGRKGQYRYHRLFAEFLREQLQRDAAYDQTALHMRAAAWYEQHGRHDEAIRHALAAGRTAEASRLIKATARQSLMRGEAATILGWFQALPDDTIRGEPLFCLVYAWVLTNSGQVEAALSYLDHLEATAGDGAGASLLLGEAAAVRARVGVIQGKPELNVECSQRALALLPAEATALRTDVYLDLAFAHRGSEAFAEAEAAFLEAIRLGREAGNLRAALVAAYYLADTYQALGRPQQAARLYQQALAWCQQSAPPSALACWAHAGLGGLLYEWGDLVEAGRNLRRAIELGLQSGEVKILMYARIHLAHLLQAQGQPGQAAAVLQEAGRVAEQARIPSMSSLVDLARLKLWLRQGQLDSAAAWAQQHGLSIEGEALAPDELTMLAWLSLALSQAGQPPQRAELARIAELVEARCTAAAAAGLALPRVGDLIILAAAHLVQGQRGQAIRHMALACSIAEPMGLVQTFVDSACLGSGALLRQVAERQPASPYLRRLLAALNAGQPRPSAEAAAAGPGDEPPAEALNPRELEVLQQVALGRSNQEIADEMVLALSTVKWYLRNIYGKLGVSRRTQALARARALGLLAPR